MVETASNETTVTISWTFTNPTQENETFTVMYGTASGDLNQIFHLAPNVSDDAELYTIQLESLEPGTTYYYQIRSMNPFDSVTNEESSIRTVDGELRFSRSHLRYDKYFLSS